MENNLQVNKSKGVNLANALRDAAQLIGQVRLGISLTDSLIKLPKETRSAAQSLAFTSLRNRPILISAINQFVHKEISEEVEDLILVAASTLLKSSPNTYDPHTLVNEAVKAAGFSNKTIFAKGLINAILRRLSEKPEIFTMGLIEYQDQYPSWWLIKLKKTFPKDWQNILKVNLLPAAVFLRVNLKKITRLAYLEKLNTSEIETLVIPEKFQVLAPQAICISKSIPVAQLPGFDEGEVSIQDLGAQMAAHLVNPSPGDMILDACAAPGGKTTHLLELANCQLIALEKDALRSKKITENLDRLGLSAQVIVGDATRPERWWDSMKFDTILVDAPCSATGIIRRHPDILYLRRESDFKDLERLQTKILINLWQLLKPGGRMIYVTCSIFPEEGEKQCQHFAENHQDALRLDTIGQLLPDLWHDGFYFGVFQKRQ